MIERSLWHPVCAADALPTGTPLAATLLGEALVLWRDGQGAAQVFSDRCPHRGASLSLGCVRDGQLECAYHGWRFDGGGRCVAIPAVPGFVPPATHTATRFDLREAYGLLWVRLEPTPDGTGDVPPFDAEHDPRLRKVLVGPYDVATSAPRIVENFLDLSHFGFIHAGLLGDREHTEVAPYTVTEGEHGVAVLGCDVWQPQSTVSAPGGSRVAYDYAVPAPYTAMLAKAPEVQDGYRESIALFVSPLTPESSRVWFRYASPDFSVSDEQIRAFQHTIFMQDAPVLESQRPHRLPLVAGELHSAADRSSAAYRRYLQRLGITFGVC